MKNQVVSSVFEEYSDSSCSEDDNDPTKFVNNECFWDEKELEKM